VIAVSSGGNLGYAGGINIARRYIGVSAAVLVLNPDVRIRPGALATMLRCLENDTIGVVVPRIVDSSGSTYPSLRREPAVLSTLGDSLAGSRLTRRGARFSEVVWNAEHYDYAHTVDWATGAALLIRADVDRAVGDWTEDFFLYSEEVDYLRRVRESGGTQRRRLGKFSRTRQAPGGQSGSLLSPPSRDSALRMSPCRTDTR
jgi:GT2 family glycosyltransferase